MKIKIIVVSIISCLCLSACSSETVVDNGSSEGLSLSSSASEQSNIIEQQSTSEEIKNSNSLSTTALATGYEEKELDYFSLWLPEAFVVKLNAIYEDNTEMSRKVAEVTSVDAITDMSSSFANYDDTYTDAKSISEHKFGAYSGKSYHLQKEVSEGGITGFQNTIVYCIKVENNVIVINFYPVVGTGIYNQREEFEKVLNSIKLRKISS